LADVLTKLEGLPIDHWLLMPAAVLRIRDVAERIGWKGTLPPLEAATPNRQLDLISAGTECVAFLGATCQPGQGKGAHLHEDYAVVEAVDPVSHEPVPDGTRGYLLCTSLGRDNPMIRYNLEDVVRIDSSPCDCGETHRRAFWDGRGKDVVEVGTKRVLPIDVWRHLPVDTDYVLLRKPGDMTRLEVRVEGDVPADFVDQVEADLAVPVALERLPVGSLDKAIYKFNRVVDVPA